jgi:hypothetical protein
MTYHWWRRRKSLRLQRRCHRWSHSHGGACPPAGGAHGGGEQYPCLEGEGGVLELWPIWSARGSDGQYPPEGGGGQYPPGGGYHVEGCPAAGDPPHDITDGGPIWEPCNMKVWLVIEYEFEFWIEKGSYTCDPSKREVKGSLGLLGHIPYGERQQTAQIMLIVIKLN